MKEFLKEALGEEWFKLLEKEFDSPYFLKMAGEVAEERTKRMVYPDSDHVFRAFKETPFSKVKVIILGQDPYNGPREATGVAFDCGAGYVSPSFKKVIDIYDLDFPSNFATDIMDGKVDRWAHEGVFLLNSALTVPHKSPGMHQHIWRPFISKVIDMLAWDQNPRVFVFLGNDAQKFMNIVRHPHLSFRYEHPAAPTYSPVPRLWNAQGFFRNINAALEQLGVQPIDW